MDIHWKQDSNTSLISTAQRVRKKVNQAATQMQSSSDIKGSFYKHIIRRALGGLRHIFLCMKNYWLFISMPIETINPCRFAFPFVDVLPEAHRRN